MNNTVLITGTSGHLGSRILSKISKRHRLIALSRSVVTIKETAGLISVKADLLDLNSLTSSLTPYKEIPLIIHVAGVTDTNSKNNFDDNILMAKNIVSVARLKKCQQIIFISSNAVNYSSRPYALTKKRAEEIITQSGVPYTIIRPTMLFDTDSPEVKKISQLCKDFPFIPLSDRGKNKVQPILTSDVVTFVELCLSQPVAYNKTYTIGGKDKISYHSFINLLFQINNIKKPIIYIPGFLFRFLKTTSKFLNLRSINDQMAIISRDITVDNHTATSDLDWHPHGLPQP